MNTHISFKKLVIKLIAYLIISISVSFNACAKESDNKTDDGILFTFMRDNYRLEAYAAATGANITKGDDPILASLPYRKLYHKLQNKLLNLAVEEAKIAVSKNDITEEMQKVMNSLISEAGGGFDRAVLAFRERFKEYPNTADLISLIATSINDAKEIFDLSSAIKAGNTKEKQEEGKLLVLMYDDAIQDYKNFIKQNEDGLKIISDLADNNFKFKETTVKCKDLAGHALCETENNDMEIKNFSEILPYVIELQKKSDQSF